MIEKDSEDSENNDQEICDMLIQVYDKMLIESKPLDSEIQKLMSENITDLF